MFSGILLSLFLRHPERGLKAVVREGLEQIIAWSAQIDPDARIGLNIVLTDGEHLIGSRFNRSLHYLVRDHIFDCRICGQPHVHHSPATAYQSVEIASEPVTLHEDWYEVPNKTLYSIARRLPAGYGAFGIRAKLNAIMGVTAKARNTGAGAVWLLIVTPTITRSRTVI